MLCDKGRTIETGQCRSTGIDYSCYVKACTTKIYRRYGAGQCENFIWCYNGTEYKYKCPAGTVFDEKHGKCEHLYYTCKPCGTKSWQVHCSQSITRSRSCQTKDYTFSICCFSAKHAVLRRKRKDWLTRNQDYVSEWGQHVYPRTVVSVSQHYKNPTKRVGLVQSGHHHHLIH